MNWAETGIDGAAFERYVGEQIYSLPGVERPEESMTILLTGSRATGTFTPESDVDIEVLCPPEVYEALHGAAMEAGIIQSPRSFFHIAPEQDWERYFGPDKGRPHFSVTSLHHVERHFREYDDVYLWIWTNAKVVADPGRQFERIRDRFDGYPGDVLVRKIKYRVLLAWYWDVEVFPAHAFTPDALLAASTAVVNSINEFLRVFFLVEGRPFPYTEKLWHLAADTALGRAFLPMFRQCMELLVGEAPCDAPPQERIRRAWEMLCCSDLSAECRELDEAVDAAMGSAGVEPEWIEAGYRNIDELLLGELGPMP